jgi:hypothetical protein
MSNTATDEAVALFSNSRREGQLTSLSMSEHTALLLPGHELFLSLQSILSGNTQPTMKTSFGVLQKKSMALTATVEMWMTWKFENGIRVHLPPNKVKRPSNCEWSWEVPSSEATSRLISLTLIAPLLHHEVSTSENSPYAMINTQINPSSAVVCRS